MERTLAIIKPDAVGARHTGRIIQRIEDAGFQIRAMRMLHLSGREAEGFYAVHRERPFFGSLTQFMSRGPVVVFALEAPDAIKKWRTLMGATDPAKADPGSCARISDSRSRTTRRTDPTRPRPPRSSSVTSSQGWSWRAEVGKLLVIAGLLIAGIGLLMMSGLPIGRLPGDISIKRGNFTFYFPLATSIIASLLLTLLLALLRR